MAAKRVVLTGYEPWSHASENPTLELLDRARTRNFDDIELITLRVPVDSEQIVPLVDEALDTHRPDVWISLGLFPGSTVVAVERTAVNVKDFPVPDNIDAQPVDEPVFAEGPFAYRSTLPIKAMVAEMNARAVPAKVSNSASTYLCNQIMYAALHLAQEKALAETPSSRHIGATGYMVRLALTTRRPGRDRAGCLRKPGRGSCQYLTLLAQPAVLTPEPSQLLALGTGQALMRAALVSVGPADPVADRLSGRLELPSQLLRRAARANQLDHLLPELGCIRRTRHRHRELLSPN